MLVSHFGGFLPVITRLKQRMTPKRYFGMTASPAVTGSDILQTKLEQGEKKNKRCTRDLFFFFSQEMTMMLQKISPALIYARVPGKGTRYTYLTMMFRIPRHWECTKVRSYTKIS